MTPARVAMFAEVPLFVALGAKTSAALLDRAVARRFAAGEMIVEQGEPATSVYAIAEGRLRVATLGLDGSESSLGYMGPGEIFGEVSVLDGEARSATVVAVGSCELYAIDGRDFLTALSQAPRAALLVIEMLAHRLRMLTDRAADIDHLPIPARLAKQLLQLAASHGRPARAGNTVIALDVSQRDIGRLIGATRESVNKSLAAWAARELIELVDGHFVIRDAAALERIARNEPS